MAPARARLMVRSTLAVAAVLTLTATVSTLAHATQAHPSTTPTVAFVEVGDAEELAAALSAAQPGQTINLASGEYRGSFVAQVSADSDAPISLTGPSDAVIINDGPSGSGPGCPVPTQGWDSGYGLWLYESAHWQLSGFTVADSKKGIILDRSPNVTIDDVAVRDVEEEAVHFRQSSSDGVIQNSRIQNTGLVKPEYGEGVYIGSAHSNWDCHGNTDGADRSDRVQVLNNRFGPDVTAEHIDIKEGTAEGVISGNSFDGQGLSGQNYADSWIDVKGTGYVIEGNTGSFTSPGVFANGYESNNPSTSPDFDNGCGNTWRDNDSDLGNVGEYAIKIASTSTCAGNPNIVYASNTVSNAREGLTNIDVTP